MNEWSPLKVDVLKVIENFMDMYPYPAPETLVVEAIANCLDANATNITISIVVDDSGNKVFRVEDNGKGMYEKEFEDNYHALSISSKIKGQGIGFAGVGSKLYLAFLATGESIITETKSESFHGASKITVIGNEPRWVYVDRETLDHTGTIYEVKLRSKDADFLTKEKIAEIIRTHYNAILLGRYREITITLDGEKVKPWKPEFVSEAIEPHVFNIRKKQFKCHFGLAKEDLKQRQGIEIVVFGKKIRGNQWFDLDYIVKPHFRNKITGQILADGLATLLTTNKCDIRVQAGPALWASFRKKAYDTFSSWLSKVGAVVDRPLTELDPGFRKLSKTIEKEINKLLKDPIFSGYNPFLRKQRRSVLIKTEAGAVPGEEIEGIQKTKGTIGGEGIGHGVDVLGPDQGKSLLQSEKGEETGTIVRRRIRYGIAIHLEDNPDSPKEAWLTPQAIVINIGHPVSLKCSVSGYPAWVQHVLKCVFLVLLEQNPPQTFNATVDKLSEFYLKWSTI